jgi:hypothetical protein
MAASTTPAGVSKYSPIIPLHFFGGSVAMSGGMDSESMTQSIVSPLPLDGQFFSEQELAEISATVLVLPGKWFVGGIVDMRENGKPRVWIHPDPSINALTTSFGFRKGCRLTYVTTNHQQDIEYVTLTETPYANLNDALAGFRKQVEAQLGDASAV